MRLPFQIAVLLSAVICAGRAAAQSAQKSHGLTPELRDRFLNDAEKTLRSSARVTPLFWDWLALHPQIRTGLLTSSSPVPAQFAENLDALRIALGPDRADRYAGLLLAVSLGSAVTGGGDGAYLATALGSTPPSTADDAILKTAALLKDRGLSLVDFIAQEKSILEGLKLPPLKGKERGQFIDRLAYATKTYPPRETLPLAESLKRIISHQETRLEPFADKGPQWPLFPLETAPWPLLAPMRQTVSAAEMDYLWDRFTGKLDAGGKRLVTYSRYTWDYEKPDVRYKNSPWHPSALPRIIEDGGVCGRQSTLAQLSQVALGRPAVGMYQPGHRALLSYRFDPKTGGYSAVREQSITSPDKSTCQWYLPPVESPRSKGNVGVELHVALALAVNSGLDRYTDSLIACHLARTQTGEAARQLLDSAVSLNPYNLEAWYALAKFAGTNTGAVNLLIQHLDTLMASPDQGLDRETELSADSDLAHQKTQTPDFRRDANLVATQTANVIAQSAYSAALSDRKNLTRNRANLRAEVTRRAALKLPYGNDVQSLVFRYDIAAEGPARTQQAVAVEIQQYIKTKPAKRKQLEDPIKNHVGYVLAALSKPGDRATWLATLCRFHPESERFLADKDGKIRPEPLYGFLQAELLKSIKSTGPDGIMESRRIAAEFEDARAKKEQQTSRKP